MCVWGKIENTTNEHPKILPVTFKLSQTVLSGMGWEGAQAVVPPDEGRKIKDVQTKLIL